MGQRENRRSLNAIILSLGKYQLNSIQKHALHKTRDVNEKQHICWNIKHHIYFAIQSALLATTSISVSVYETQSVGTFTESPQESSSKPSSDLIACITPLLVTNRTLSESPHPSHSFSSNCSSQVNISI